MVPNARDSIATSTDMVVYSRIDAGLVLGGGDGALSGAGWLVWGRLIPATRAFYGVFHI
jgi:hypothetical protein